MDATEAVLNLHMARVVEVPPGGEFQQREAQREQVRPCVHHLAQEHLWSGVKDFFLETREGGGQPPRLP